MKHIATYLLIPLAVTLLIVPLFSSTALAQFTLDQSDFSALIGTQFDVDLISYSESSSLISIVEQTGEDQTWDLTDFAVEDSIYGSGNIEFFNSFDGKLGADYAHFSDANVMAQSEFELTFDNNGTQETISFLTYSYSNLSSDELVEYGSIQAEVSAPNDPVTTIRNTPASILYPFPLSYGTTWNDAYTSAVEQSGVGTTSNDFSVSAEVDGWGDVVIGNTTIPALRIRSEETTEFAGVAFTSVTVFFIDQNGFEFANITADFLPFSEDYDTDSANLQITAYDQISSVSSETSPAIPQSVNLKQNFPNPFNPTTQITYQLNSTSEVSLTVYSLTGQKVSTLIGGERQPAGEYNVPFDAGNLASGIYIYRLRVGEQMFTRKMTLLK